MKLKQRVSSRKPVIADKIKTYDDLIRYVQVLSDSIEDLEMKVEELEKSRR